MFFSPAVTQADLSTRYPGASLIALPDTSTQETSSTPLTCARLDELAHLVQTIGDRYGCSPAEFGEMRATAARDPHGALVCFRAMVALDLDIRGEE